MVAILIPTKPDDAHSVYVQLALIQKGHKGVLWYTADFPVKQTHSFELNQSAMTWQANGVDFSVNNTLFNVVWYRRPQKPTLSTVLHPDDKENAEKEITLFYQALWQLIAPAARWINPVISIKRANCKLLQLKVAAKLGFKIPHTLVSNDPTKIKDFICRYKTGEVIYKTLYPLVWIEKNAMRLAYTNAIQLNDLPEDEILQSTPGIFQEKIDKAYELRVTYFGQYPVAVKLRSQEHPKGGLDWRHIPTKELVIEEYALPDSINQRCQMMMASLGIVFGCFDFIVTTGGEYYFLEVNEQGQFLWIEEINPDIKMLDIFTEFLICEKQRFYWQRTKNSVALADFSARAKLVLARAIQ